MAQIGLRRTTSGAARYRVLATSALSRPCARVRSMWCWSTCSTAGAAMAWNGSDRTEEDHERGSKVSRTGYQRIIEAVRQGTIHVVLVYMFDRWGRDGVEWLRSD